MSLAETQEIMSTMKELIALLNQVETKTKEIVQDMPQTEKSFTTFRQLERVSLRYLALTRQMGLPDNAEQVIQTLTRLLVMIRMVQMSLTMLAGGPYGIAMGAAGILMTGLAAQGSFLEGY